MQERTTLAWTIESYTDQIFNISYVRFLTSEKYESIKLPSNFADYKYSHLLQPNYILQVELVKTRKNWILKTIINHWEVFDSTAFSDFIKVGEITKLCKKYLHEDQEINLLPLIKSTLDNKLAVLDVSAFEKKLSTIVGFGGESI